MRPALLLLACVLSASLAAAAPPSLPQTQSYQGVLLDSSGDPQTGSVDLTVRIYDAISAGTLLYKQSFLGVALVDGIFSVVLGPSGLATDAPANPLTTSFETALSGDLPATGASRFLEVTVGASGALPRTQLLAVPYAFQARRAESADVAAQAEEFGGLPPKRSPRSTPTSPSTACSRRTTTRARGSATRTATALPTSSTPTTTTTRAPTRTRASSPAASTWSRPSSKASFPRRSPPSAARSP